MNYEEMTPKDFSIAVLKAYKPEIFERDIEITDIGDGDIAIFENGLVGAYTFLLTFNANRPDDVFPIIFEHGISLKHLPKGCNKYAEEELWVAGRRQFKVFNKNPLRAAMISFLLKMEDVEEEKNVRF